GGAGCQCLDWGDLECKGVVLMTTEFSLSLVTRRNIADWNSVENVNWSGRLEEQNFLKRIFDVDAMPSHDGRFRTASNDIWQHRVNNHDWSNDWVFEDSRFEMMAGPADTFLRFLCEMLHPAGARRMFS